MMSASDIKDINWNEGFQPIAAVPPSPRYFPLPGLPDPKDSMFESSATKLELLSAREIDVLKLMVEGHSNTEIAKRLYVSLSTVKTHVRHIMRKLEVHQRVQVAVIALRSGLI